VKYFHPWLAWRAVDWDGALLAAIPRVMAADNREAYAAAVQAMLDVLGDPATHVAGASEPPPRPVPLSRKTADGILIVTVNPATLGAGAEAARRLRQVAAELTSARAVVFDLRGHGAWSDDEPAAVGMAFLSSGLNHQLQFAALRAPGHRSRMYSGLPSSAPGGSMFYHAAYYVRDGAALEARPDALTKTVIFLADKSSSLPPIAAALQAGGCAKIVAQGSASDASLVERQRFELAYGVQALMRTSELVYEDGTTGLLPDLVLPAEAGDGALEAALALARNPQASASPPRRKPAPYGWPPAERVYAESDHPRVEMRLLAAFRIWAAFRYFFAYRDLMQEDWDSLCAASLPAFIRAADARQYALAIAELVAHARDTHVEVSSRALEEYFGRASPPIRTRMIEGLPVVTQLLDEEAARKAGVAPGDVVLEVDGEAADARMRRLSRYLSASTPQSLDHLIMQRWLRGPPAEPVRLKLRDGKGRSFMARLPRRIERDKRPWRAGPVTAILPGNIGYADLERLAGEQAPEMFEKFRGTGAIIFDLRGYPQGAGWLIAPRLTERKAVVAARFRRPLVLFPDGRTGDIRTLGAGWEFIQHLPESAEWKYLGPTVALIDERAMSQAEHAGLFLRAANGTRLVGSRTAGADGDVARFWVPGGIIISFSGQEVRHPDGAPLQGVGLIPNVEVKPTIQGVRAGRDEVLERALEYLGVREARVRGVGEAR